SINMDNLKSKTIYDKDAEEMIRRISDNEIKEALYDICDNKAPRPDGYTAKFYKKAWDVMIQWIMVCVKIVAFTINVNNERVGYFKGGRGLSQGDPISPYIFTLVMEVFTLVMQKQIKDNEKFKFHWGCKELQLTHLCFADDFLVLYHVFFGNVKEQVKKEILDILPFNIGSLPVTYLGVPLITKHLTYTDLYWASVFILPKSVIRDIDKLLKGFLWCQGELSKGKSKVAWKQICRPKNEGGLGIKSLEMWNDVLMSKHLWNVATLKGFLWVKWINVYKLKGESIWRIDCDKSASHGWKQILSLRGKMRAHIFIKAGDGSNIFFWLDKWWGPEPLTNVISWESIRKAGYESKMKLKDMISNGKWKWPNE
ncbi:RNA-directed DNA polymerase, eukaryota, reverse transcriptase zinc-binding domain protein, partial [Tanacetum coccineum]